MVEALRRALNEPEMLGEYPDLEERALRGAIALHGGVAVEQVAIAHGVIPLLEASLRSLRVERCLLPVPAFSEYRSTLERVGVAVTPYVLWGRDRFRYEPGRLMEALRRGGHDALLLANPQNPSGALCGREEMLELVEEAGRLGVRVLLDEAFIDYAASQSLCGEVGRMPNLTVFRSLTKFYGVPGLRVANAVANAVAYAMAEAGLARGIKGPTSCCWGRRARRRWRWTGSRLRGGPVCRRDRWRGRTLRRWCRNCQCLRWDRSSRGAVHSARRRSALGLGSPSTDPG